jgi:perosamine synthetase
MRTGALPAPVRGPVPHSRPCLGPEEEAAALRVLRAGRLAPGAEAARLEAVLARLSGGADAVALQSGTLAVTLALRALGIGPRDGVALPSHACAALLHAVRAAGARPRVCDIDPAGLALDPDDLARRGGEDLRAVILVHPFGSPVRVEPFRARGLLVIEDCAQALGATLDGRPVGSWGDAAVFSFGPTKVITCGGPGGALSSPRASVVRLARDLAGYDEKEDDRPRINGLMGDLHAAIAAVQAGRLREFAVRRAAIAARYDAAFAGLSLARPAPGAASGPLVYRYLLRTPRAASLLEALRGGGVIARRPVHRPLHRILGLSGAFPGTDAAHAELVSLPIGPAHTDDEIERVVTEVLRWHRSP